MQRESEQSFPAIEWEGLLVLTNRHEDQREQVLVRLSGKIRNEMTNGISQLSRPSRVTRFQGIIIASNGQSIPPGALAA
jgi:hypothetical protein